MAARSRFENVKKGKLTRTEGESEQIVPKKMQNTSCCTPVVHPFHVALLARSCTYNSPSGILVILCFACSFLDETHLQKIAKVSLLINSIFWHCPSSPWVDFVQAGLG